jgi:rubrerythrin
MHEVPAGVPTTIFEAFDYIASVKAPTLDDLRLMVVLEAAGKGLYDDLARGVENGTLADSLRENGRQELAHAHRVSRAIGKITGQDYPVPSPDENPYLSPPPPAPKVTRAMLAGLAEAEFGGEALYESWAASLDNEEAAALLRQNGREETDHGGRLRAVLDLAPA